MSPKKSDLIILVAVLGAAALLIRHHVQARNAAEEKLASLSRQRAEVAAKLARERQTVADLEKNNAELGQQKQKLFSEQAQAKTEKAGFTSMEAAEKKTLRIWANLKYAQLFQKLGLTPAQIDRFEDIVAEHQLRLHEITEGAKAAGAANSDPDVAKLQSDENRRFDAAAATVLGEQGNQQLQEFQRTEMPRYWVGQLAGNVYDSQPLSAEQSEQLVQILANQSESYRKGGSAGSIDWNGALAQAPNVLSPAQLAALQALSANYQAEVDLQRRIAAAKKTNPPSAPPASPTPGSEPAAKNP